MPQMRATYRLQFHSGFTLNDARGLAPYLQQLGISHVYASPLLMARPESTHGYEVVDPTRLNPVLGTEEDLHALVAALHKQDMGILLDIVPNHMAIGRDNRRWEDVLAYGRSSPYAKWFDIDWHSDVPELRGRILLPILGERRRRVLEKEELKLAYERGTVRVSYFDQSYPLDPTTIAGVLVFNIDTLHRNSNVSDGEREEYRAVVDLLRALPKRSVRDPARIERRRATAQEASARLDRLCRRNDQIRRHVEKMCSEYGKGPAGVERLEKLLSQQVYRLVYWRRASREINYRRFFDINELIGLRVEDEEVFAATHERILAWVAEHMVDALRIDHIDGLADPREYLVRLADATQARRSEGQVPLYVEKILAGEEELYADWPVAGTTGYEFLNAVEAVFIQPSGLKAMDDFYSRHIDPEPFPAVVLRSKCRVLRNELSAYVRRLGKMLRDLSVAVQWEPEPKGHECVAGINEMIACMTVYRTYLDRRQNQVHEHDCKWITLALTKARQQGQARPETFDLLESVFLGQIAHSADRRIAAQRLRFIRRFQQVSGTAAAKGVEDTAFYACIPLLSRNEVGGHPDSPPHDAIAELHRSNQFRAAHWPNDLLCVTTHDTKRSADVRARLDVLSERSDDWLWCVRRWQRMNLRHRARIRGRWYPDANTEYLLYQTLVGAWPLELLSTDQWIEQKREQLREFRERIAAYMVKAAREAKRHTSWTSPDQNFESAVTGFVEKILSPDAGDTFLTEAGAFAASIARPGFWNSLSRTLIHLTAPGVPDLYQGDELWNFSLVDPDNRRPVDYTLRCAMLTSLETQWRASQANRPSFIAQLIEHAEHGRIKLHVIRRTLEARAEAPQLFAGGAYQPLKISGRAADHGFAFLRSFGDNVAVTVVPRWTTALSGDEGKPPIGREVWKDTYLHWPENLGAPVLTNVLTGKTLTPSRLDGPLILRMDQVLYIFPAALLLSDGA